MSGSQDDVPGWGWGPTDNPDRTSFSGGVVDTGNFDPAPGSTTNWTGALKEISGGLKDAGKGITPSQRPPALPNTAQAHAAFGQAGTLGALLQLLAQRANLFNAAAHSGSVPAPTRPGGGLLGL